MVWSLWDDWNEEYLWDDWNEEYQKRFSLERELKTSRIEIKRLAQSLAETLQENNDLAKENKRLNNEMQELIKHHE